LRLVTGSPGRSHPIASDLERNLLVKVAVDNNGRTPIGKLAAGSALA